MRQYAITINSMLHNNHLLVPHIVILWCVIITIVIRVQSEVWWVLKPLQFSATEGRIPRGNIKIVKEDSSSSISGCNNWEATNHEHHQEREVAIELKRGDSPRPVILRVSLTPQRVVSPTHMMQITTLRDPAREQWEANLDEPGPLKNEAHAAAQFGDDAGARRSQLQNRAEHAHGDGHQQEIVVTILDATGVLALEVEQEKLFGEGERADEV